MEKEDFSYNMLQYQDASTLCLMEKEDFISWRKEDSSCNMLQYQGPSTLCLMEKDYRVNSLGCLNAGHLIGSIIKIPTILHRTLARPADHFKSLYEFNIVQLSGKTTHYAIRVDHPEYACPSFFIVILVGSLIVNSQG
ncbi:hypothetical protein ElyMa_004548000 [Elysia marginata]|uniref:Uncharacterized protein n=1 Tax=Elysia marginata TaxID=1093978 RepID=A0AAV4HSL3_9GAST|nr:hypothetical protein ElyMa_004548000 [Elysia marginata]